MNFGADQACPDLLHREPARTLIPIGIKGRTERRTVPKVTFCFVQNILE